MTPYRLIEHVQRVGRRTVRPDEIDAIATRGLRWGGEMVKARISEFAEFLRERLTVTERFVVWWRPGATIARGSCSRPSPRSAPR